MTTGSRAVRAIAVHVEEDQALTHNAAGAPTGLPVRLPSWLPACLSISLLVGLMPVSPIHYTQRHRCARLPAYLHALLSCLLACLSAYLPTCLPAYLPTCLPAYLPTYRPVWCPYHPHIPPPAPPTHRAADAAFEHSVTGAVAALTAFTGALNAGDDVDDNDRREANWKVRPSPHDLPLSYLIPPPLLFPLSHLSHLSLSSPSRTPPPIGPLPHPTTAPPGPLPL